MPRSHTAVLRLALVSTVLGGLVLLPVLRDPGLDGERKLTLLSLATSYLANPVVATKAFHSQLAATRGHYSRAVTAVEKAWLVDRKLVRAKTPNAQVLLVSIASVAAALAALRVPTHVVKSVRAILPR